MWSAGGALVLFLLAAAGPFLLFLLLFRDFEDVRPGSLAWHLVLPGFLTSAPLPAECGEPHYYAYPLDGLKPQEESVSFQTRASLAELRAAYARQLAACRPVIEDGSGFRFECGRGADYDAVILSLDPGDGCRRARLSFLSG
jgi:hypothetical protein